MSALVYLRLVPALAFVGFVGCGALWAMDALWPGAGQASPRAGRTARRLASAFALGMGVVALWMLLLSRLHVRISLTAIIALAVFPAAAYLARRRRARRGSAEAATAPGTASSGGPAGDAGVAGRGPSGAGFGGLKLLPKGLAVALLGVTVAVVVATSFLEPIVEVDATAGWALHAKVFYYDRTALPPFLTSGAAGPYVSHWPPVVPLVQTWGHIAMGAYDDRAIKLVFAAVFVALLALVYGALRERLPSSFALVMVFVLATVPAIAVHFPAGSVASAYADVPFALFLTGAAASLAAWAESRRAGDLALGGLLVAAAVWVKVEGLAFAAVSSASVWLFWLVRRLRSRRPGPEAAIAGPASNPAAGAAGTVAHPLLFSGLVVVSLALYALYKAQFRAPIVGEAFDPGSVLAAGTLVAGLKIAGLACLEAVNPSRWGFVWVMLALAVALRSRRLTRPVILMPLLLVAGQVVCAIVVMAASGLAPEYWAFLTVRRMLLHVVPTAVIIVGLLATARQDGAGSEAPSEAPPPDAVRAG